MFLKQKNFCDLVGIVDGKVPRVLLDAIMRVEVGKNQTVEIINPTAAGNRKILVTEELKKMARLELVPGKFHRGKVR